MKMLSYLKIQFIALLAITLFCFVNCKKHCSRRYEHKKCTDFDFENCENKCCTNEAEKRIIVCYFTNWALYRDGIGKYTPENVDTSLCTHINYAFASLDSETLTIKPFDSWADIDKGFYKMMTSMRDKGMKVLISIGGWNNSKGTVGWRKMFNNATARAKFVESVLEFMKCYNFSGLDLDFEYPACPQGDETQGGPDDAENFNQLVRELKKAFNKKYLLTAAVSAGKETLEKCYKIHDLCHITDWINVMAYDYHGSFEKTLGANAPLCGRGGDWGVFESVQYLTTKCPADKMVLGVPFYGHCFTLADKSKHNLGDKAVGPGDAGVYTKEAGTLAYYEICQNEKNGWKKGWSKTDGSYAWNDTQIVFYDDIIDIKRKCCLINKMFCMKGAMFWDLDFDDFNNVCGFGAYPLLKTLNQQLRCLKGP